MYRYAELKMQHRCTRCGKQDERTLDGRISCAECAAIQRERVRAYTAENHEKVRARERVWRAKRLAEGMCLFCGKNPAQKGRQLCGACARKRSERYYRRKNGK